MADSMKESVAALLKGIDRYNPDNLTTLESYVQMQAFENTYNLDANLAVLKLYQFNPALFKETVATQILLKALMNLPHTDFVLCKCLIGDEHQQLENIARVIELSKRLEMCQFKQFWEDMSASGDLIEGVKGFSESIRKYISNVITITYEIIEKPVLAIILGDVSDSELDKWINLMNWEATDSKTINIANQEMIVKSKNIKEKITFDNMSGIIRGAV